MKFYEYRRKTKFTEDQKNSDLLGGRRPNNRGKKEKCNFIEGNEDGKTEGRPTFLKGAKLVI